jgi:hypothetical protein
MAGHLGAFLYRYSRTVLFLQKDPKKLPGATFISSESEQAKLSYGFGTVLYGFKWDEEAKMMKSVSSDMVEVEGGKSSSSYDLHALTTAFNKFENLETIPSKTIKEEYCKITNYSMRTADVHFIQGVKDLSILKYGSDKKTEYKLNAQYNPF